MLPSKLGLGKVSPSQRELLGSNEAIREHTASRSSWEVELDLEQTRSTDQARCQAPSARACHLLKLYTHMEQTQLKPCEHESCSWQGCSRV